jgi:hypothetical protein
LVFHFWLSSKQHIKKSELHDLLQGRTLFYVYIDWTTIAQSINKYQNQFVKILMKVRPKYLNVIFFSNLLIKDRKAVIVYYVMRSKNEVLCAAAGRLTAERSEAGKPAKAHKTIFVSNNIYYFFFKPS